MLRLLPAPIAFLAALVCGAAGWAQPSPEDAGLLVPAGKSVQSARQAGTPDFIDLDKMTGGATPQVARGTPAVPSDWPATLISQPSGCTATIVGPRVILTAAHCVRNAEGVTAHIVGRPRTAVCDHHPAYSAIYDSSPNAGNWDSTSADYALCLIATSDVVNGIEFEVVGAGDGLAEFGAEIRLLGFGCSGDTTAPAGYGVLRTAAAKIVAVPSPARPANNYIKTDWRIGGFGHATGGAVCPGDSGGAAYWPFTGGIRRIVAVNSRTQTKGDRAQTLTGVSYLSSMLTPSAGAFMLEWANRKGVEICGITAGAQGCRQ